MTTPTAETVLNSYLPFGWHLTHLILDSGCWQAITTDDEHVAVGTGVSIERAIAQTSANILAEQFVGRIFDGVSKQARPDLTSVLEALRPKLPTINRRL